MPHKLKFRVLPGTLAVCQLPAGTRIPEWATARDLFCVTNTPDELSVVCDQAQVPADVRAERDWTALKLEGPFPFAMTGVLSSFLQPLAEAGVSIFAVSTFNTDYVLVKSAVLEAALTALRSAGHELTTSMTD